MRAFQFSETDDSPLLVGGAATVVFSCLSVGGTVDAEYFTDGRGDCCCCGIFNCGLWGQVTVVFNCLSGGTVDAEIH